MADGRSSFHDLQCLNATIVTLWCVVLNGHEGLFVNRIVVYRQRHVIDNVDAETSGIRLFPIVRSYSRYPVLVAYATPIAFRFALDDSTYVFYRVIYNFER